MISDAAIAEFEAMEAMADRTLSWPQIGQELRFIQDAHDAILTLYKQELTFMAHHASQYQKHELRALWRLVDDEQRERVNGKAPRFMTINERTRESMQRRCEAIHERIPLAVFLERECGIDIRRNRCRCPLHNGNNASSFSIRDRHGKCFVCQWSGDVISLAQAVWGLSRPVEAIRRLERW